MSLSKEESAAQRPRLSCLKRFDALWFCYCTSANLPYGVILGLMKFVSMTAPVHQMQQYYRLGVLDNCSAKWADLFDCLSLKTKTSSQIEVCGVSNLIAKCKPEYIIYESQLR
ncbi:hypothetical protein F511_42748 [Dorcoceras hygrometricum]|uniref:Uncharacterized protein n=1 Tax=Dorcoceras hygrometricum TaxID=472368 RepID=A0A2Z7BNS9_9LAMI|nr:hypothetical protein F511_42748 [Dorcoceras hygrometricum]